MIEKFRLNLEDEKAEVIIRAAASRMRTLADFQKFNFRGKIDKTVY